MLLNWQDESRWFQSQADVETTGVHGRLLYDGSSPYSCLPFITGVEMISKYKLVLTGLYGGLVFSQIALAEAPFIAEWQQMTTPNLMPSGVGRRNWTDLTFNKDSGKVVLFGGSGYSTYLNDIWEYDAGLDQWTNVVPHSQCPGHSGFDGPDGRDTHSFEYDPVNKKYWVIGGGGYKCGPLASRIAGTGTTTSTLIDPTLTETTADFYKNWSVSANSTIALVTAYDPGAKALTLANPIPKLAPGVSYKLQVWTNSQTWEYAPENESWSSLENPHWGPVGPSPNAIARSCATTAYSNLDKTIVQFGSAGRNDLWALDLTSKTWTQKQPDSSTSPLFKRSETTGAFVYDSVNDVFILFGGRCTSDDRCQPRGQPLGDTWVYQLKSNSWVRMTPPVSPSARMQHHMAFDAENGVVVLFGGVTVDTYNYSPTESNLLQDLWVYDYRSNTWTEITAQYTPPKRYIGAMVYDPINRVTVLYGGSGPSRVTLGDVWQLRLARNDGPNEIPTASFSTTPMEGDTNTSFSFDAGASIDPDGTVVSYNWNFGDGTVGTGNSVSHVFGAPGQYTVGLTVTDNRGAEASITMTIEVADAPPPPPPVIDITSVRISGTVNGAGVNQVLVGGLPVNVTNGGFEATILTNMSSLTVDVQATGSGGTVIEPVTISAP